jgi:hypothetical protein
MNSQAAAWSSSALWRLGLELSFSGSPTEGHLQSLQAKLCVKAVGQLSAENMPGVEIHDRHQVQEAFLQWYVDDVSPPHVINRLDITEIHQAGITLMDRREPWCVVSGRSPINPCGE